jgi:hypothetical protein
MNSFWADHWWLLIPLGAFTIPLAGIAMGALATWLHYHSRNRTLDAIKAYAQQGREPPAELLQALGDGGDQKWKWQAKYYAGPAQPPGEDAGAAAAAAASQAMGRSRWADPEAIRARTEYYTARAAARAARWRAREPIRRWNNAIFLGVGAAALYFAAEHYARDAELSDRLYVGSVIVGALAAAAVLAAILATLFRPE